MAGLLATLNKQILSEEMVIGKGFFAYDVTSIFPAG